MTTSPSLRSFIPAGNFRDDEAGSGDLARLVDDVLQPVLDLLVAEATRWEVQVDPDQADEASVDAMLLDLGNPFEVAFGLSLARKRLLVRSLVESYKSNGTARGIISIVRALTGVEITEIVAPAVITFWRLGRHTLADTSADARPVDPVNTDKAVLGPSTRFMAYSFQVRVGVVLTAAQRTLITTIVRTVKPAHTHFLGILEPTVLEEPSHWALGRSRLETESTVHE